MPLFVFAVLIVPYYINTSEIPVEVSCENMISSLVKRTCYLHKYKDHRYYNYIIIRALCSKKAVQKRNSLEFHWCLYNKQNITWPLGDTKFLFESFFLYFFSCFEQLSFCFTQFGGVPNAWTLIRVVTELLYSHNAALTLSVFPYQELQNIIDVTSENQP